MQTILIVEPGSIFKNWILERLSKKYRVFVATSIREDWLRLAIPDKQIIFTDPYNSATLVNDVVGYMEKNTIIFDGVGTFWEAVVTQTSDLSAVLGLHGCPVMAAYSSSQNKLLMRKKINELGKNKVKFQAINIYDADVFLQVADFSLPCVIKPVNGSASHGVKLISSVQDIPEVISDIQHTLTKETEEVFKNYKGQAVIEEYLEGIVVSVDGFVQARQIQIIGNTEFIMGQEPYFTQIGSCIPARIDKKMCATLNEYCVECVQQLGFDDCGFHGEFRISKDGNIKLLEIAARLAGGPIVLGYEKAYGIDLIEAMVGIWLGKKVNLVAKYKRASIHKNYFPALKKTSIFSELKGLENIVNSQDLWDYIEIIKPGDILEIYPKIPTSPLYYALSGDNINILFSKILELEERIICVTKE